MEDGSLGTHSALSRVPRDNLPCGRSCSRQAGVFDRPRFKASSGVSAGLHCGEEYIGHHGPGWQIGKGLIRQRRHHAGGRNLDSLDSNTTHQVVARHAAYSAGSAYDFIFRGRSHPSAYKLRQAVARHVICGRLAYNCQLTLMPFLPVRCRLGAGERAGANLGAGCRTDASCASSCCRQSATSCFTMGMKTCDAPFPLDSGSCSLRGGRTALAWFNEGRPPPGEPLRAAGLAGDAVVAGQGPAQTQHCDLPSRLRLPFPSHPATGDPRLGAPVNVESIEAEWSALRIVTLLEEGSGECAGTGAPSAWSTR